MVKKISHSVIKTSQYTVLAYMLCMILSARSAAAQNAYTGTHDSGRLWGMGTSITYPIGAQIYMLQGSYSLWQYGDILAGLAFQNWKNEQGRSHAYTMLVGYRQFLWQGLHLESELWPAYNPFHSSVDGKTYSGFELWVSIRLGYRFDFTLAGRDFFILVQPGLGFGVARQNPWPDMDKNHKPVF